MGGKRWPVLVVGLLGAGLLVTACTRPQTKPFTYTTSGCGADNPLTGSVSVRPAWVPDGGTVTVTLSEMGLRSEVTSFGPGGITYELPLPDAVAGVSAVAGEGIENFRVEGRALRFWYRHQAPTARLSATITAQVQTGVGPAEVVWPAIRQVDLLAVSPSTGAPYPFTCRIDPSSAPLTTFTVT